MYNPSICSLTSWIEHVRTPWVIFEWEPSNAFEIIKMILCDSFDEESSQLHLWEHSTELHQQQPWYPSETPGCSGLLWWLWLNLLPCDGELYATNCPGDESCCILSSLTLRPECGDISATTEWHMYYTLRRGCSYAVAGFTTPGDVYVFPWPIAKWYLSAIATYRMPHSPQICLALRFCHLFQYSLRFEYIACSCI